jgi:hypothetical protein
MSVGHAGFDPSYVSATLGIVVTLIQAQVILDVIGKVHGSVHNETLSDTVIGIPEAIKIGSKFLN